MHTPPTPTKRAKCQLCDGTGWLWLMRSWFTADGLRREHCGICGGTGESSHRPDPEYVRQMARLRERAGATNA